MSANLGYDLTSHGYKKVHRKLTPTEVKLLKRTFCECDSDYKNYLTRLDLKVAMVTLFGCKPSKHEANEILTSYGYDNNKQEKVLCEKKFIEAMTIYVLKRDEDEDVRHTFLAFDTQCKGYLTFEDLRKIVSRLAPHLKTNILESAFRELDRDGDQKISYTDFDFMMKYGTE